MKNLISPLFAKLSLNFKIFALCVLAHAGALGLSYLEGYTFRINPQKWYP